MQEQIFKESALWADSFYKSKCPYVCVSVCLFVRHTFSLRLTVFLPPFPKVQCQNFFCPGDFTTFMSKSFQIWDHFFPLLFPKDSKNLKSLDIGLWEVRAKRPLNGVRKCDGQTNKQTDTHTDISTYRKNRPRGPILWKQMSLPVVGSSVNWTF